MNDKLIQNFISDFARKQSDEFFSTSFLGASTSTATESKPLTKDDIDKALGLVKGLLADVPPVRPFDEIHCSEGGLRTLKRKLDAQDIQDDGLWVSVLGVHVQIVPAMPDDTALLIDSPKRFGDVPKVYAVVNLGK